MKITLLFCSRKHIAYCATEILIKEEYYFSFPFIFVCFVYFCNYVLLLIRYCFLYKWSSFFIFSSFHWTVFVVFNLLESHVLFLKSSPFLMSFLNLFAIAELIHRFVHSLETTVVKNG